MCFWPYEVRGITCKHFLESLRVNLFVYTHILLQVEINRCIVEPLEQGRPSPVCIVVPIQLSIVRL